MKFLISLIPKKLFNFLVVFFYHRPNYNSDGIITSHTCNFLKKPRFISAKNISLKETGFEGEIDWRLHTALWLAKNCSTLEGDFVECGVDRGFLSRAIVSYLDFNSLDKDFYLLDTFEGIPLEDLTEREIKLSPHIENKNKQGNDKSYFNGTYENVKRSFKDFERVKIIKGKVPGTLSKIKSKKIAYISLDMNNAFPEIEAANFLWGKLVKGGAILLDDYAYSDKYAEQRIAFDKFAREKEVEILTLATGQGMIIKS